MKNPEAKLEGCFRHHRYCAVHILRVIEGHSTNRQRQIVSAGRLRMCRVFDSLRMLVHDFLGAFVALFGFSWEATNSSGKQPSHTRLRCNKTESR
jgi:hypothetical protein